MNHEVYVKSVHFYCKIHIIFLNFNNFLYFVTFQNNYKYLALRHFLFKKHLHELEQYINYNTHSSHHLKTIWKFDISVNFMLFKIWKNKQIGLILYFLWLSRADIKLQICNKNAAVFAVSFWKVLTGLQLLDFLILKGPCLHERMHKKDIIYL